MHPLVLRAALERREGRLDVAEELLARGEAILEDVGDPDALAGCVDERGHLERARIQKGSSPQ